MTRLAIGLADTMASPPFKPGSSMIEYSFDLRGRAVVHSRLDLHLNIVWQLMGVKKFGSFTVLDVPFLFLAKKEKKMPSLRKDGKTWWNDSWVEFVGSK